MGRTEFAYDERLGILVPDLQCEWEDYTECEQEDILFAWEQIRGTIPDRIMAIERVIVRKQLALDAEEDFAVACRLNSDIAELASAITDLHIWYRMNQQMAGEKGHS